MTNISDIGARRKPIILCILDGWGINAETRGNAIELGKTPNWHRMMREYPHSKLGASGTDVGLPDGQMGNSEVGHMNIGAGRVVPQLLGQIEAAVKDGTLGTNQAFASFADAMRASGGICHLFGLVSDGGVHSHIDHIAALANALAAEGIPTLIHAALDGRDTAPSSATGYINDLQERVQSAKIATVGGRYYSMDRNKNWDRAELAYNAMANAVGPRFKDATEAVRASYDAGITDEFVVPAAADWYEGMHDGDGLLIANFRADRVRQIAAALAEPKFDGFARGRTISFAARLGIAEYSAELNKLYPAMFPPPVLRNILGEVISDAGLTQLRIAETEKYAHVTFFFNGGEEKQFPGEERVLVESPRVATYDIAPAMSAREITDEVEKLAGDFDVIIINYANGDMVGHTGIMAAAEEATAVVDECIGRLEAMILRRGGAMLITADHGNVEEETAADGSVLTAHTTNPVPAILIGEDDAAMHDGRLADVAPTVLKMLGIEQPDNMTGKPLY